MSNSNTPNTPSAISIFGLAIRPKTLPASLSPVLLGSVLVPSEQLNLLLVLAAFGCALCLQISVNLANDFFDAKNGIDTANRVGPTRVTQSGLASSQQVATGIVVFLVLGITCGLVLVAHTGWPLLGIGVLCVLGAVGYSGGPYPIASHALGEAAVLFFFGWVAVIGSYYVHTLTFTWTVFFAATALGAILSAVMLVNNIRDITTDAKANKNTLAVVLGLRRSKQLYTALLWSLFIFHTLAFGVFQSGANLLQALLLTVIPLALVFPFCLKAQIRMATLSGEKLNTLLAFTALIGMIYSLSVSLTILLL